MVVYSRFSSIVFSLWLLLVICVFTLLLQCIYVLLIFFFLELFFAVTIVGDFCCVRRYYNMFMFCLF